MPIRIYALAKELKIDNKILVDICTKAGITGKGSALASLTDEEAAKLKAYMNSEQGASRRCGHGASARDAPPSRRFCGEKTTSLPRALTAAKFRFYLPKVDKPPLLKKKPAEKPPRQSQSEEQARGNFNAAGRQIDEVEKTGEKAAEASRRNRKNPRTSACPRK